ncbi:hypothetical protein KKG41_06295 [Patescibacteria group bacterium]|nr:hypothetical protein [Patescibacteria group bacterium]MBU1890605.1 hypothetical protein [Patescibacteria group bacterium]
MKKATWLKIIPTIIVVAIIGLFFYYYKPSDKNSTVEPEEKLYIPVSIDNAEGNFKLTAESQDILGITPGTKFILTSQEDISKSEVEESLAIAPAVDFEVKEIEENLYEVIPDEPLTENQIYKFTIRTTIDNLASVALAAEEETDVTEYRWAYQVKQTVKITGTLPRDAGTGVPTNSGIEVIFSADSYYNFDQYFEITPSVNGSFEKHKRTAVFVPEALDTETLYTVTIKAGLPFEGTDDVLAEDYTFKFETTASDQSGYNSDYFSFRDSINDFTNQSEPVLEVYNYPDNKEREFTVYQYPDYDTFVNALSDYIQYPAWAYYSRNRFTVSTDGLTQVMNFKAVPESYEYREYVILPSVLDNGYYLIETSTTDRTVQSWIQISEQAAYLSVSKKNTLVWLNDINQQKPIEGAVVTIPGLDLKATSNEYGVAFFETPEELSSDEPDHSYIFTITGPDGVKTVIPGAQGSSYYDYDTENRSDEYWQYLYVDRPIYQKSDTVNFWGLAKLRDDGSIPEEITAKLIGFDYSSYYGDEMSITETSVTPTDTGTYLGRLSFQNLIPGYYTLKILIGDAEISQSVVYIENYIKPSYMIELSPDKKVILEDESNVISVNTQFFEGTPVPSVDLAFNSNFGSGNLTTDENGNGIFTVTADGVENYQEDDYISVYSDSAEAADISSNARYRAYPSDMWLDYDSDVDELTATLDLDLSYLDLEAMNESEYDIWGGELFTGPVVEQKLTGVVKKVIYDKIETGQYYDFINKVTRKTYRYDRRLEPYTSFDVDTDINGEANYKFDLETDSSYEMDISYTDNNGRTVTQNDYIWSGHRYYDYDYSDMVQLQNTDEDMIYSLNDSVNYAFLRGDELLPDNETPNNYLYFQAKAGIQEYWVDSSSSYSFTFEEKNIPNTYIYGVWFNGSNYVATDYYYYSYGSGISYDTEDSKMSVEISSDQDKYQPGEEVTLTVNTSGVNSQPISAKVNLNLVDEAIYALRDEAVDPLASVYSNVSSGILRTYISHEKTDLTASMAERGGCFLEGTPVLMGNGGTKPIEEILVGEYIWTIYSATNKQMVAARVAERFEHIVDTVIAVNKDLYVTPNHILWLNGNWQPAENIKPGDKLVNDQGDNVTVKTVEYQKGLFKVFNLHIDGQHTFFASGYYVHNDKAGARKNFQDAALFEEVETGLLGQTTTTFTLPDNVTSWRVTAQGISDDLDVGSSTKLIPVTLPLFVETNIAKEYLTGDKPIIKAYGYGNDLESGESVDLNVTIEDFGYDETQSGQAFESASFQLPEMTTGVHDVYITATAGNQEDTILKKVSVVDSHWEKETVNYYTLAEDVQIEGADDRQTTLMFMDRNRGYFYRDLMGLYYSWGERVDQKYAKKLAAEYMNLYFEDNYTVEDFDGSIYQTPDGGISILPYSSSELPLSAHLADLAASEFDISALTNYFNDYIASEGSTLEEVIIAYYGLANLEEPVLNQVIQLYENNEISDQLKLYIALTLDRIGAGEYARAIYNDVTSRLAETQNPYTRLVLGEDEDDYLKYTVLAAILANRLSADEEDGLYSYVRSKWTDEILINVEKLIYLRQAVPSTEAGPVSFKYSVSDRSGTVSLEKYKKYKLSLSPDEFDKISFSDISGTVGVISYYAEPADPDLVTIDNQVDVVRSYQVVGGNQTNTFSEGDIILVTLDHTIKANAIDDSYQVTDYLPSGLTVITQPFSRLQYGSYEANWPYLVDGQKVVFMSWKGWDKLIKYYARVNNQGVFNTEPVMIQGYRVKDSLNMSDIAQVTIE